MLNVLLTYRLARDLFASPAVGLASAVFMAISPMALLINATLMSHTWAMFCTLVVACCYWRALFGKGKGSFWRWAIVGGLFLGLLAATRPITAVATTLPLAVHALLILAHYGFSRPLRRQIPRSLIAFALFGLAALPTFATYPLYNYLTTGDARTNTYLLQWEYDRVGFGEGIGLNKGGHTLAYGWRNARADVPAWMRDLYGFTMPTEVEEYARANWGYGAGAGLSLVFALVGLVIGRKQLWLWILLLYPIGIIGAGLFYWIGSVVNGAAAYSVRYYYEATFAVSILSGYGLVQWAEHLGRSRWRHIGGQYLLYFLFGFWCYLTLVNYAPTRFRQPLPPEWNNGLFRYNKVGQNQLEAIAAMRADDPRPLLIIVLSNASAQVKDNWRDYGAALAQTSPFLDSDIVVARVFDPADVGKYERRFSDRLVLFQVGETLYRTLDAARPDIAGQP
jgi:4-amino-4-deoxy-L-arabinose transferase-like glycosyltransferase